MSSPSITLNLFKLKRNKSSREIEPTDPEVLALLNQIDLGDQQNAITGNGLGPAATSVANSNIPGVR